MDVEKDLDEDSKGLPTRLFDRLDQIPGYSWHRHVPPSRSSYDSWQVSGLRYLRIRRAPGVARRDGCEAKEVSNYSPMSPSRPPLKPAPVRASSSGPDLPPDEQTGPIQVTAEKVLARISSHVLRLEREYHLCRSLLETANPDCKHVVQPLELVRLSSQPGDGAPIVVSISKWPGNNYLQELVGAGTAFHASVPPWHRDLVEAGTPPQKMSLLHFLDFAIGASECLELLHHGQRTVHGELRGDAFHFNKETGVVKLKHFGSGPLSFEHGLTSVGWSTLSKEVGVKSKLQFIAPEQTGRMAAVPDSRTDLYSLGVLFWVILAGEPVFDGSTPMETVQNVLSKRIPPVSTKRLDIPDVISEIIQKMTSKHIGGRYHSASGLKYDLLKLQKILSDRDGEALNSFKIATRDVSSRFNLPKIMVGRRHEHEQVVGIIQKVYRRYSKGSRETIHGVGPHAAFSDGRTDSLEINDGSSDDMSSHSVLCSRGNSESIVPAASHGTFHDQAGSSGFVTAMPLPQPGNPAPHQSSSLEDGPFLPTRSSDAKMLSQDSHDLSRRSSRMYRSLGRCEVISITGAAGLGKSYLVQSVQSVARGFGYLASAKFDPAKKQPFEPVLKVMSSLFSQMFSEGDVTTEFHQLVRAYVAPVSSLLQTMLDIPQHLLGEGASPRARPTSMSKSQPLEATVSFLRGGSSAKSMKPSSTFLDVLRLLARHKFICLCFDDLQFADEESLNLISSIIASRMPLVVIVTYREQEMLGERVRCILESDKAHLTRIQLGPLSEDDIIDYVAAALYRPRDYVIPLAAVIQEKTAGNPFLLREVLDACHRRHCVWFDFKSSSWVYDLDLVFKEFEADSYGEILNNDFILRRLNELPTAARVILAWASLLGNAFSFSLVQKLTSGEFDAVDSDDSPQEPASAARLGTLSSPKLDTVAGLHAALQACILIPGDDEDQFRFAHDRYIQAAIALRECHNTMDMHFVIAQTMMKYRGLDERDLYVRSEHVCKSIDIIKTRVESRERYRDLLAQAAQRASDSGAPQTAVYYHQHCQSLLQSDPWEDGADKSYEETLRLYTRLSESWWYAGQVNEALTALQTIFEKAKSPVDKVHAWVLQSRIYTQTGDAYTAFRSLKLCLGSLGLDFEADLSWEQCDAQFHKTCAHIRATGPNELLQRPTIWDPNVEALGAVLIETTTTAFWTSSLIYYQLILRLIDMHSSMGAFPQVGMGYSSLAVIAVGRFSMIELGAELSHISHSLLSQGQDASTLTRVSITYWFMLGHLYSHLGDSIPALEAALEAVESGDRLILLVYVGAIALAKFYVSSDLVDLENECNHALEDFPVTATDVTGGPLLVGVKQVVRALQGKTRIGSAATILSDDVHDSVAYVEHMTAQGNLDTSLGEYYSLKMVPLYLFGYYDAVVAVGNSRAPTIDSLWSMRATRLFSFYLALALLAISRRDPPESDREAILEKVTHHIQRIKQWEAVDRTNYAMWSLLLTAELNDTINRLDQAMQDYDQALTHAQQHGFLLEEALTFELAGGFYLRRGAKRAAQSCTKEAVVAYRRMSAHGKATQVTQKFDWLLQDQLQTRTVDVACQTDISDGADSSQYRRLVVEENERSMTHSQGMDNSEDRTRDWVRPDAVHDKNEVPGLGIDVIDLQSILTSSQVISSELQVDKLLPKMCEIILGGNSADFAAIILDEEEIGWAVMASGGSEHGLVSHSPGLSLTGPEVEGRVAKPVALYSLRFREAVFLQNLLLDERFSNVCEKYVRQNPLGKSVISLPIIHGGQTLLGALYLEAPPNTFTDRNLTVLQLLVNQFAISIANAYLFKQVQKVSASNTSMIELQKQALAQARESELKAKSAEAEALRSLRLKEEAARAKSIFLANVSHELRTPLNGMIGNSELLKATPMTSEQEQYADSIRVCADTLLTVINDILDYSKLEAGKMQLVHVPFNLQEAIQGVVRALSCTHVERKLETVADLSLPDVLVLGDPIRLHQILMNLLSNSYKFTPAGSVRVRAETEYETDEHVKITCSVADTGIGISPEQLKRLFTPFSQADNSTARRYGGSGLGLSICKSLIQVMGGHIWIESESGVGTTVRFTLALPKAPKGAAVGDVAVAAREPEPDSLDGTVNPPKNSAHIDLSEVPRDLIRICIAEDNAINQKIALTFVQRLGFQVEAYDNGKATVEALQAKADEGRPYHLVLMDVQMPELDGYEATREIRADDRQAIREVLIIAMTASAIQGDREKCIEAGMNDYLAKPVRASVLKNMLEKYLQQPEKRVPNIQDEADSVAQAVMKEAVTAKIQALERLPSFGKQRLPPAAAPDRGDVDGVHDDPFDGRGLRRLSHESMPAERGDYDKREKNGSGGGDNNGTHRPPSYGRSQSGGGIVRHNTDENGTSQKRRRRKGSAEHPRSNSLLNSEAKKGPALKSP